MNNETSDLSASRGEVLALLTDGANALNSATQALDSLSQTLSEIGRPLTSEQAAPFSNLVDALIHVADTLDATPPLPQPPPRVASPSSSAALPSGAIAPPPAPAQPVLTEDEIQLAEDAAREERRVQNAPVRNTLADSISSLLTALGSAMLVGVEPNSPPITIRAPAFTAVFAKQSVVPNPAFPPPKLVPGDTPVALFVSEDDAVAALGSGDADGFILPSTLPALQGLTDVETTILHFPNSIRDAGPPAAVGLTSVVASPATSLLLRSNGVDVKVRNGTSHCVNSPSSRHHSLREFSFITSPFLHLSRFHWLLQVISGQQLGAEILLATKVTIGRASDELVCGLPQSACDNVTQSMRERAEATLVQCNRLAKRSLRRTFRAEYERCVASL